MSKKENENKSKKYPTLIKVGREKFTSNFKKHPRNYFIVFKPDIKDEKIEKFLKQNKMKILKESLYQKVREPKKARRFKKNWVTIPKKVDITSITEKEEVSYIAPVYIDEKIGVSSAAVPLPNVLLIETKEKPSEKLLKKLEIEYDLKYNPEISKLLGNFSFFKLTEKGMKRHAVYEIINEIQELTEVTFVEYNWLSLHGYDFTPNDTHWADQWNLTQINMEEAWDIGTGQSSTVIAILDTGCELGHPDLTFTPNTDHFNGQEWEDGDPTPYDASPQANHGTPCAGLAAARLNNGQGVAGVAGGCNILPAMIGVAFPNVVWAAAAINWAVNHNANVISMSFSVLNTAILRAAVQNAENAGLVLVAATGNGDQNNISIPASYPEVIAVGASDQNDERKRDTSPDGECWWGSNFGNDLEVMAPGVFLWSTDRLGTDGYNDNNGGTQSRTEPCGTVNYPTSGDANGDYYSHFGGTSGATPQVAGLAALLFSKYPTLTNQQIREIICWTCDKASPGTYNYAHDPNHPLGRWHQDMGYGRINAARAMCEGHWVALGVQPVELLTPNLNFIDIPENVTTVRAIVLRIRSCREFTFEIIDGPSGGFIALDTTVVAEPVLIAPNPREARIWIQYTGTNTGDVASGTVKIRCVETGEEFPEIPINANTISKPKVASVLSLDKSGSMDWPSGIPNTKRIQVLKFSAPIFVNHLGNDDAIGVVSFNHDAYELTSVQPGLLSKANAIAAIQGLTPGGSTAIGDAVEKAHDLLQPVTGYDAKATVVLTDGDETASKYIADVMDLINERVYAIGLGTAEVIKPAALTALTNGTGGYLVMTDNLGPHDYLRLMKYFLQVLAGVTNADIILDPEGWLKPGQEIRIPFPLTETDISAEVVLLTVFPEAFKFHLEDPNGQVIDPQTASTNPGVSYFVHDNEIFYRITLPVLTGTQEAREGIWHAVLTIEENHYDKYLRTIERTQKTYSTTVGVKAAEGSAAVEAVQVATMIQQPVETVLAHGVQYSLNVLAHSNLRMKASLVQNSYEPGANLTLRTRLTEYGLPVTARAKVLAELVRPDSTKTTLTLDEVEPGVFEVSTAASMSGIYKFNVLVNGTTLEGYPFSRGQLLTGAVWRGGDEPIPTSKEDPKGLDWRCCGLITLLLFLILLVLIFKG